MSSELLNSITDSKSCITSEDSLSLLIPNLGSRLIKSSFSPSTFVKVGYNSQKPAKTFS
jgi:hypothetical protein